MWNLPDDIASESWLADWAAEGIAEFERLLAKHAAFVAYLVDRGL